MTHKPESGGYRNAVDHGRTHDKISFPDPAAVPLQADAESGGHSTPNSVLAAAQRAQSRQSVSESPRADAAVAGRNQQQIPGRPHARLLGGLLIAMGLLGLGTAFLTLP